MQRLAIAPAFAFVLAFAAPAAAAFAAEPQAAPAARPTTLVVTAQGEVRAVPDEVTLAAGVVSEADDAASALAANGARMQRLLAALKAAGVPERSIQTTALTVAPRYRYADNEPPALVGFRAENRVDVQLADATRLAAVVDGLARAGADRIDGPNFAVSNRDSLLDGARVAAVKAARQRAALYAGAAGLRVVRIRSITEGEGASPMPVLRAQALASPATPVARGESSLTSSVTVEFELQ